ncbi:Hypothetical predicted protein [Mytilus galloprovincialis]|uniref:Uncharacterized protein n=1 Tax=Mytilus galloprovincialis TaxID=29158 RepID=A0A8B6HDK8_MYTGA|nr:Hypothetical predicted protein [Mytilus galloprovincialis]
MLIASNECITKEKVTSGDESSRAKTKDNGKKVKTLKLPTLNVLRDKDKVGKRAKELYSAADLSSSSSSDDSDSNSLNDNDEDNDKTKIKGNDLPYIMFKDRQKRTAVSGEARAVKDRVKYDVPWTHEHAQTKSVNYSNKDFGLAQLVRGETFIMHNIEKQAMSMLRQKHLINLLYLVEKYRGFAFDRKGSQKLVACICRRTRPFSRHPLTYRLQLHRLRQFSRISRLIAIQLAAHIKREIVVVPGIILEPMATKSYCMFAESVSVKEKIREIRLCYILRKIVRIRNDVQLQINYIVILL